MTTWDDVYTVLEEIRQLEDDWDGEGSPAPGGLVVDVARGMVQYFRKEGYREPSRVHASVNGSIWFEWWINGDYFEVEVAPESVYRGHARRSGGASMSGPHLFLFLVHVTHPYNEGWEEREAAIYHAVGRKWDDGHSADGVRELWYYCDSLGVGREIREAITKVGGVSCVVREPINGR